MSDYHIRSTEINLKSVNTVFHIAITSVLPDITPEELNAMKAGSIYENVATVRFSSLNLTNAQRLAEVEAAYTAAETNMLAEKQITLNFYGKSGDVV